MLATILSSALQGIDATLVEVEVDVSRGLPQLSIVGLPEASVRESRERVRSAIRNSGYVFPAERVTINLAPADLRKEGSAYDLPIALGLLAASGTLPPERLTGRMILGELSLDGRVKPVRGALPVADAAAGRAIRQLILPAANAREAAIVGGIDVFGVTSLGEAVEFLLERAPLHPVLSPTDWLATDSGGALDAVDLAEVHGQQHAKRALEIAAAGGHNLLLIGPPGAGKTMLAARIATILPQTTRAEAIEIIKVRSVSGVPQNAARPASRPFRAPHHTISAVAVTGGGPFLRPGEVTLAHHGVLFLDELPEFPRHVLEVLRQPMEERRVTLSRAHGSVTLPASFLLVAAMNPCPCGYLGDARRACTCSAGEAHRYRSRISGPLLDRIDLQIEVPALRPAELRAEAAAEPSAAVRARVGAARSRQVARLAPSATTCNAQMTSRELRRHCAITPEGRRLLETAADRLGLSARAYGRILKVARTIADLAASDIVRPEHVAESIQYRTPER